jgi:hypothetical protein
MSSHARAVLPRRLDHGTMELLSHVDDGAAGAMLVMARCRCRVILVMVLPKQPGRDAMCMLSHASDDPVESCYRWRCRGAMSLLSHADNRAVEATWSLRDVSADDHTNVRRR